MGGVFLCTRQRSEAAQKPQTLQGTELSLGDQTFTPPGKRGRPCLYPGAHGSQSEKTEGLPFTLELPHPVSHLLTAITSTSASCWGRCTQDWGGGEVLLYSHCSVWPPPGGQCGQADRHSKSPVVSSPTKLKGTHTDTGAAHAKPRAGSNKLCMERDRMSGDSNACEGEPHTAPSGSWVASLSPETST